MILPFPGGNADAGPSNYRNERNDINIYIARSVIIGALEHNIIRWLLKDRTYSLLACADDLVEFFMSMLKEESSVN